MLNAQELKAKISDQDIVKLLKIMNTEIYLEDDNVIVASTICHHGNKPKLYYYKDTEFNKFKYKTTNIFHCYTDCGDSFDIIELVCRSRNYSFTEAINWICIQLNYSTLTYGFGQKNEIINDWEFINNIRRRKKDDNPNKQKDFYDKNILNIFQRMYLLDWINEGISLESMYKYDISYSTLQQKIIIPHYSIDNQLMGVRARSTKEEEIEQYGKYSPFQIGRVMYSHPLSQNLYGLNINKETIKRKKKIMLVESEKSVLQCDTMFGEDNYTVALCGSSFSNFQRDLILGLEVNEAVIGLDKQFQDTDSEEAKKWAKHIRDRIINKLAPYCNVTILWDSDNLLPYKASPTDQGKETLLRLMDKKIYTGCI